MYYENEGTCTYMYFLPLKFSQYPSRPIPVPELFGKYPTRPVPKSKTPTRQTLATISRPRVKFLNLCTIRYCFASYYRCRQVIRFRSWTSGLCSAILRKGLSPQQRANYFWISNALHKVKGEMTSLNQKRGLRLSYEGSSTILSWMRG